MAGTVSLSSDVRWSAASWLFDWVLKTIAHNVNDRELAASIIGIADENLGWLSLEELSDAEREEISRVAQESLMKIAEQDLPESLENRAEVLDHLRELVGMISSAPWRRD